MHANYYIIYYESDSIDLLYLKVFHFYALCIDLICYILPLSIKLFIFLTQKYCTSMHGFNVLQNIDSVCNFVITF